MKVAVINFSGNVGKSTVAKHLMLPRMRNAALISVESINADEDDQTTVRGRQFGALQEQLMVMEEVVIDVGSSNVEDFVRLMSRYRGSHEDVDTFLVPTVRDAKQIRDTIATIRALAEIGVPASRIRVVFNKIEPDEAVEDVFYPLFEFHRETKLFSLRPKAAIAFSELYQRLRLANTTIAALIADTTDYRARLRQATTEEAKAEAVNWISMRRLARSAQDNLDAVFGVLTADEAAFA